MKTKHKILIALGISVFLLAGTAFLIGYTRFVYRKGFIDGAVAAYHFLDIKTLP
jgi:hypothetical protein